jgi:hypothetical protein
VWDIHVPLTEPEEFPEPPLVTPPAWPGADQSAEEQFPPQQADFQDAAEDFPPVPVEIAPQGPKRTIDPSDPLLKTKSPSIRTSDFVFMELVGWIPILNLVVYLVWMFSSHSSRMKARYAKAKLIVMLILFLGVTITLTILLLLVSSGQISHLPFLPY